MKTIWLVLFAISAIAEIVAILLGLDWLYSVAKPLLMITLLLYFISASQGYPGWRIFVIFALIFSWGGDVLLMQDGMFAAGLGSFLIAHLFYISAYLKTGAATGQIRPWDLIKFVLIGLFLIWLLYPGLGGMLIPVLLYSVVLLSMGVFAHKRRRATSSASFILVAFGALLFVLSDSLIALNKFAFEVPSERLLVMSSYIAAQFLIIQGLLKHKVE